MCIFDASAAHPIRAVGDVIFSPCPLVCACRRLLVAHSLNGARRSQ